jgi:hypothetical protein
MDLRRTVQSANGIKIVYKDTIPLDKAIKNPYTYQESIKGGVI